MQRLCEICENVMTEQVYALRIQEGKVYLIAYLEATADDAGFRIMVTKSPYISELNLEHLSTTHIDNVIMESEWYQNPLSLTVEENSSPFYTITTYLRDKNNIIVLSVQEFQECIGMLKDGDYLFALQGQSTCHLGEFLYYPYISDDGDTTIWKFVVSEILYNYMDTFIKATNIQPGVVPGQGPLTMTFVPEMIGKTVFRQKQKAQAWLNTMEGGV